MSPAGRRAGSSGDTREEITEAARAAFAERGYAGASLRQIAAAAGVDPSLVVHYFGSKRGVFAASIGMQVDVEALLASLQTGDIERLGERLVRLYLTLADRPQSPVVALLRSATADEESARMVREFITQEVIARLIERVNVGDRELRATLVGAHLIGTVVLRCVVRVEPLASADPDLVVAWIAPTIQRYLTGPTPHEGV